MLVSTRSGTDWEPRCPTARYRPQPSKRSCATRTARLHFVTTFTAMWTYRGVRWRQSVHPCRLVQHLVAKCFVSESSGRGGGDRRDTPNSKSHRSMALQPLLSAIVDFVDLGEPSICTFPITR